MPILHRPRFSTSASNFLQACPGIFRYLVAVQLLIPVAACSPDDTQLGSLTAPVEVPLTPYIGRLVTIDATVGPKAIRLIFDTAAGETIISPEVASQIGCTPSGRSVGYRMNGERITYAKCPGVTLLIGGIAFAHDEIAVWDVKSVLPEGVPPVDGVLSLKTLARQAFTLQLAERHLIFETITSYRRRIAAMTRLRSRLATGLDGDELTALVRGAAPGAAWYLIDSGNLDVVQAAPYLQGTPASPDSTWQADLELEGLPALRTTFRTRDIIYDGVLSEEFLSQWNLTFDLSVNEIWAAPVEPRAGVRP